MEKRKYKGTGEAVSLLGYGVMRMPFIKGSAQREIDEPRAEELIDYAYRHGVNYFDTAYVYHGGTSESFIGKALKKYPRDSFNLATKLPPQFLDNAGKIDEIFNEQLEKCQVDYFDFYLVHGVGEDSVQRIRELNVYARLKQFQKEGKIRRLGFSFHGKTSLLKELVEENEWDFVQIQLNYLDWELQDAKGQYEVLESHGVPAIVMEPVRGGSLVDLGEKPNAIFKEANPNASNASWAIRYVASLPGVLTVLSGMSTLEQVKDNVATMENFKPLTKEEYAVIDKVLPVYKSAGAIPCTGCRYCMECPSGVDIPKIFAIYNQYRLANKSRFAFKRNYTMMDESEQAHNCTACGECVTKCPQGIQIPDLMKDMVQIAIDTKDAQFGD